MPKLVLLLLGLISGVLSNGGVITDLKIQARIEQRYAQTTVTSTMKNPNDQSMELKFKMTLPKTAFISSLIMQIEGRNFTSTVKEKSAARKIYEKAKGRGKTTGLVEQRDDTQQKFEVSANVAARGKVIFYLRYEELLRRVKGKYVYAVDVKPGHVVPAVLIDVTLIENEAIQNVTIMALPGNDDDITDSGLVYQPRPGEVQVSYVNEDSSGPNGHGLDGKFALSYDIDMRPDAGEIQVVGNFFVHHFSPEGLPKMPVHTIFVLDVSYSMSDGKLEQMKEAMVAILKDLKVEDTFELIAFASDVQSLGTFSGKKRDLQRALKKVQDLKVVGSTNLYDAYMTSVRNLMKLEKPSVAKQIVFLTDGVATAGQTNPTNIRRNVKKTNSQRHPIFGLAFGNDADFKLLKEVSADNRAFARKIDFGENTQDQLKGFYEEISTPLMAEIDIDYLSYEVNSNSIVRQGTSNFYSGGEVVSAGQIIEGVTEIRPVVKGIGKNGPLQFQVERFDSRPAVSSEEKENFVARLWAYLMVQDLLEEASVTEGSTQVENIKAEALKIALRFNFVTKLTSLVVVRPEDELPMAEKADEVPDFSRPGRQGKTSYISQGFMGLPQASPGVTSGYPQSARMSHDSFGVTSGSRHTPRIGFDITGGSRQPARSGARSGSRSYDITGGSRQPARSGTRSGSRSYVDNDPHFVVSAEGAPLPFCFDLHAQHDAVLNLIRDPSSGIVVNGQVRSAMGRAHLTYFTSIYLAFGDLAIIVTPDSVTLQCPQEQEVQFSLWPFYNKHGKRIKSLKGGKAGKVHRTRRSATGCGQATTWKKAAGKRFGDVLIVLPKRRKLQITLKDGDVQFVVLRSKNKYGQSFLGFYLEEERIFSSNTSGIIGEFSAKNVTTVLPVSHDSTSSTNDTNPINVTVQHWNLHKVYETSEVSGYLGQRRSLLDKTHVRCIHIRNGGRGLLDRKPGDYIIPCLSC